METFVVCLQLLLYIAFGHFLKRTRFFSEESITQMNNFVFTFAFPINIALSFYGETLDLSRYFSFAMYLIVIFIIQMIYALLWAKIIEREHTAFVATANCLYRGNFVIMGFPIIDLLLGSRGMALTGIAVIISQVFYNFYTVSLYTSLSGEKRNILQILKSILKNPMALGGIIGLVLLCTGLDLNFLYSPLKTIGSLGSPLALICLGYSVNLNLSKKHSLQALEITMLKTVVFPIFVLILIRILNIEYDKAVVLLVLFSAPVAVNTFTFAKKYNSQISLVGNYVIISTVVFIIVFPMLTLLLP